MSKFKKRILAMGLSLVMILTMIPVFGSFAFAADAATIQVCITISDQGKLAKANDGSVMAWKPLTVSDLNEDGKFTFDEALVAAHAVYNSAEGYSRYDSGWVTKMWGKETGSFSFMDNNAPTDVVTAALIEDGDHLTASVNVDNESYSDWFTFFGADTLEVSAGESFTATLSGFGAMTRDPATAVKGIGLSYFTEDGTEVPLEVQTDENGQAEVSFAEPGTYILSASGVIEDAVGKNGNFFNEASFDDTIDGNKFVSYVGSDMFYGYTAVDYGSGPYPAEEVQLMDTMDYYDMSDDELKAYHFITSNQFIMDIPIIAPACIVTVTGESAALADGTYNANGLSTAVLSMYHFHDPQVVIKGDNAWLITTEDTDKTVDRFDGMAYGPQSQILDPSDETNHTLVEGTATARVVPIYKEDGVTLETRTMVLPVPKSIFENGSDIYYMIKYTAGYSDTHDGDWYKASGGDYYLTGYTLEKVSDSTVLPGDEEPGAQAIELTITNTTGMFKAETASFEASEDGGVLTMALSGAGYHYLFKGTYEQAVANGTKTENWIAGYKNADEQWEFQMSLTADELGTDVPVVAVSQSYYEKYLNGQNSLERAFYPRQLNVNYSEATLVTGDYEATKSIDVDNNVSMFRPAKTASLECVGGPNSNNYKADLVLPMTTASMDAVFVGTPAEAEEAAATIPFDTASSTFTIPVKWVETFGKPETLVNLCNGEPFVMSFRSASKQEWYGRTATLDEEAGTLVFDPWVDPAPANTVDEMIAKIQSQVFTDTTYADCEAARAAWDALSDAEKALVEEYDYFGLDTGDATLDDPRNQDKIGDKELLVVSFGTSFNDSRVATVKAIEDALAEAYPEYSVRRAFTAQIIINHIYARDSEKIDNMDQALDRAVANGVKELVVQPTHLMHGAEYDEMCDVLAGYKDKFEKIIISEPLLGEVGESETDLNADKLAVAEAVVAEANVPSDTALVLMGHGTAHPANISYTQMQNAMEQLGYHNVFVGTVEGEPEGTDAEATLAKVKEAGYSKVVLRPLMVVAGDHANNDMADPEDPESWYSVFVADEAFSEDTVTCQIAGLGEIEDVQQIYVKHVLEKTATGIYNFDGKWKYYEDGVFTEKTGIAQRPDNGKWYYVEKGVFKKATGLAKNLVNGKWYYVEKGVFSKKTGVAARISDGALFYVKKGAYDNTFSGLAQGIGIEKQYYIKKGQLNKVTGVYKVDNVWRYFEDGEFTEATGIAQRPDNKQWYYVENGVFKKSTGLAQRLDNKKWYYVEKGVFTKKTGAAKQLTNGKWYYVENGKYTKSTGLAKRMDNDDWYYFDAGSFNNKFDGQAKKIGGDETLYNVVKGKMVP